jgi:hypothetical protein
MTHGHRFLKETFGDLGIPNIGWDIDPFGASQANSRMYKDMGFDYHVINRIDYRLKDKYIQNGTLEWNWKVGENKTLLTHILYDHYGTPYGFEWEGSYPCCGVNLEDNPVITSQNVANRSAIFVDIAKNRAKSFKTNHLLIPFGNDFEFRNASINFGNMSQIVEYINQNSDRFGVDIKFSLLSEYFDAINKDAPAFPQLDVDFFPYADNNESYWTGYFTSRPEIKHAARFGERVGRSSDLLFSLAQTKNNLLSFKDGYDRISVLRDGNGYIQHHDGITGTEKIPVVQMYLDYVHQGVQKVQQVFSSALQTLISKKNVPALDYIHGHDFSDAPVNKFIPVVLFNSLAWSRIEVIRILTSTDNVRILNEQGKALSLDINPVGDRYEVAFTTKIPAVGLVTYFLQTGAKKNQVAPRRSIQEDLTISNRVYDVKFCTYGSNEQRICKIKNKLSGIEVDVEQNLLQYSSWAQKDTQNSGAYIFRSAALNDKTPVSTTVSSSVNAQNTHVTEVQQEFSSYVKQTVRLYNSDDQSPQSAAHYIEIQFDIGEVPMDKEIVTLFKTNIATESQIYTDNNGYMTQQRTRVKGEDSGNYYPIQMSSFIKDSKSQLTLLCDQARGVASLQDGEIEYMLHRRTSFDDGRGLGLPLNDTTTVSVTIRIILDTPERSTALRHPQSYLLNFPLDVFSVDVTQNNWKQLTIDNVASYSKLFATRYTAVNHDLPQHVHLLTLQPHSRNEPNTALFRLYHMYEENEQGPKTEIIHVDKWFSSNAVTISGYKETKLSGNQYTSRSGKNSSDAFPVTLKPNEIRTFAVHLA